MCCCGWWWWWWLVGGWRMVGWWLGGGVVVEYVAGHLSCAIVADGGGGRRGGEWCSGQRRMNRRGSGMLHIASADSSYRLSRGTADWWLRLCCCHCRLFEQGEQAAGADVTSASNTRTHRRSSFRGRQDSFGCLSSAMSLLCLTSRFCSLPTRQLLLEGRLCFRHSGLSGERAAHGTIYTIGGERLLRALL